MKKFIPYLTFFVLCGGLLIISGCMGEKNSSVLLPGSIILNERHTGWATPDCAACHPKATFLEVGAEAAKVHKIIQFMDGSVYYDGCSSCHGENGKAIDNSELTNCVMCHSANVGFVKDNERFIKTHKKGEDLTSAVTNCKQCHVVGDHPKKSTSLYIMSDGTCLKCHGEHGLGSTCGTCHDQGDGKFYRDALGNVSGHKAKYEN